MSPVGLSTKSKLTVDIPRDSSEFIGSLELENIGKGPSMSLFSVIYTIGVRILLVISNGSY